MGFGLDGAAIFASWAAICKGFASIGRHFASLCGRGPAVPAAIFAGLGCGIRHSLIQPGLDFTEADVYNRRGSFAGIHWEDTLLHVVTFTRSTPDTAAKVWIDDDGRVTWGDAATVVNPWDEYALEETIAQAKNAGGKATVIAIGPEWHNDALKHSIAMGIPNAVRIDEPEADIRDSLIWSSLAAGAIRQLGDVELILFGKESVDVGTDQHSCQLARRLGWTMLGYVSNILEVNCEAGTIKVEKMLEQGKQRVSAKLPAVISVMKDINEPRYPNFLGIRKAAKAQIPVWSAKDMDVELPKAATAVLAYKNLPSREIKTEIIAGQSIDDKARILAERLFAEKAL